MEGKKQSKVRQPGCTSRGVAGKTKSSQHRKIFVFKSLYLYMYLPQPGTCFGCDCWSQRLTLLWAPVHLQSHHLRKTH